MEKEIIVAIISASGVVLAALIAGVFSLVKRSKENKNTNINIKQKQTLFNKGNQVGIQNNYNNNTTIQLGDTTLDDGTIIIDGGNATGGGGIRYEPSTNSSNSGENKDE